MIHSFLIIGQSNMAGRGNIENLPPITDNRLLVLRNGRWQTMYRPVNNDRPFSGFCLAETFAECYARYKNVSTGIIPCADGGTCIDQWQKGSLLYDNAIYQAKLAERTSNIAGVLWHQGEGDCTEEKYPFYEKKLTELFFNIRKDLDLYDVPFIVGGLGDFLPAFSEEYKTYLHINEALEHYANTTEMTGYASANGLETKGDNLHFDTKSLVEFGKRYFEAFLEKEDKSKIFIEKNNSDLVSRSKLELL
jgi:hypothetical protein